MVQYDTHTNIFHLDMMQYAISILFSNIDNSKVGVKAKSPSFSMAGISNSRQWQHWAKTNVNPHTHIVIKHRMFIYKFGVC